MADLALAIDTFDLAACQCPLLVITADQIFFQVQDIGFGVYDFSWVECSIW